MARVFDPQFDAIDLANLPNYQACVRATVNGETGPAFSLRVAPAPAASSRMARMRAAAAREQSRRLNARPRRQVDRDIQSMFDEAPDEPAAVRSDRW